VRRTQRATASLVVGFVSSTQPRFIQALTAAFRRRYPTGLLQFREMHSAEQARQLSNGKIDAGILRPPVALVNVRSKQLCTEPLVAVVPSGSAVTAPLTLERLAAMPIVVYQRYLGGAPVVAEQALAAAGVPARVVAEAPSTQVLLDLVNDGAGAAIVPESIVRGMVQEERIVPLDPPAYCTVVFSWRTDVESGAGSEALAALRESVFELLGGDQRG
jgi:DNA-binding transcriptional LysR family regulator